MTDEESEFFTTPMKMLDYMVARRPIVASDLPAVRQVLDDSMAIFVKTGDPKSLASGIEKALKKGATQQKVENAYRKASTLSWANRARRIKQFIEGSVR